MAARILLDFDADSEKIRNTVRMLGERGERGYESEGAPAPVPAVQASIHVGFAEPVRELLVAAAARALADRRTEVELPDLWLAIVGDEYVSSGLAKLLIDRSGERDGASGSDQGEPEDS